MKHQLQPNRWACLPTSFAMIWGLPVKTVIDMIGHDGSEILKPNDSEPFGRRTFHIQELIDLGWKLGWATVPFQADPRLKNDKPEGYPIYVGSEVNSRLERIMKYQGVLTGIAPHTGRPHAVAWDGFRLLDPNGTTYPMKRFIIDTFYLVSRFKENSI